MENSITLRMRQPPEIGSAQAEPKPNEGYLIKTNY